MSHQNVLARPYAKAAFEYALGAKSLDQWAQFLKLLSCCIADASVITILQKPSCTVEQSVTLLLQLVEGFLPEGGENFIKLLAENQRLFVLTAIFNLFDALYKEYQQQLHVDVTTAIDIDTNQQNDLNAALKAYFKKAVSVDYYVKPDMLGGVIIRTGNHVIDDSYVAQLKQLTNVLMA